MKLKLLSTMKIMLSAIILGLSSFSSNAQTTLTQGDIAFIGYSSETADSFTFIITRTGGIASGTVINFTDNGWLGSVNCGSANHFNTLETVYTWTATSAMSYLDIVTIASSYATTGSLSGSALSLATGGDQIFAFQGTFNSASSTIIAGIQMNGTWDAASTSSTTSALPNCLTNGTNAVDCNPEVDNAIYDCSVISGSRATVLAAINGNSIDNGISSNWITNDNNGIGQPTCASTSTTWNGSTWSNGTPTSSVDAIISSNTAPASFTCNNLTISSGFALNTGTSVVATIHGDLTNSGNGVSGTGTLTFTKSGTTTLTGTAFSFSGTVTVESGCTLATASKLTLASDATNTGRIGNSAGSISGDVTIQRYIPGKRAYRFLSHPFTTTQAMSIITDDIDITGNGGSTNGFTTTTTNNASSYLWDPASADNTTAGNNPGWSAITSASSSVWPKASLARVLVRGAKGEGLTGAAYTPSAATLDMTGTVNTGTQTITLTKGSSSSFVSCGNPFPCGVQMNLVSKGANIGSSYYVWDATSGTKGAYVTKLFTDSYVLPACAALFTTASANSSNTLEFQEADKATGDASVFKTTAATDIIELSIEDSNIHWDVLSFRFNDQAQASNEYYDAIKLNNPGLDFFTYSSDDKALAIDSRPYVDGAVIPLGLTAYDQQKFVVRAKEFNIPAGTKVYFHDKYLNKTILMDGNFEYWFDVTADANSQGKRFELNTVGTPTSIVTATQDGTKIQLVPNPAQNQVNIVFHKLEGKSHLRIMSVTGQVVYSQAVTATTGNVVVSLQDIPSGIYIVELESNNARFVEKLIKQ